MFSFISINWRGRSLTDIRTVVELIGTTTTKPGLTVQALYDSNWYPTGEKISDADFAAIPVTPHEWHGEWNYTIAQPTAKSPMHPSTSGSGGAWDAIWWLVVGAILVGYWVYLGGKRLHAARSA